MPHNLASSNSGLVVIPDGFLNVHRAEIVLLAARYRLPTVYPWRFFAELLSYGSEQRDMFRVAATYVDRILKGEKPADLPVQAPTKYELVINLKTANALGLTVPHSLRPRRRGHRMKLGAPGCLLGGPPGACGRRPGVV